MPLAATLTTERIHEAFRGNATEGKTFYHGHTYAGNPLGSAVALATLKVFEDELTLSKLRPKIEHLARRLEDFEGLPHVGNIRQSGMIAGVELVADRTAKRSYPWTDQIGARICREAREQGLLIRPLGDTLVIMPPLIISLEELDWMIDVMIDCTRSVTETSAMPTGVDG